MKCAMPQMGQNIFTKQMLKDTNLTPSHLSFLSFRNSFGILHQDVSLSLSFDNLLSTGRFAFDTSPYDRTIAITQSPGLKQAYYQSVYNSSRQL
jgi:hypothetical protein